MNWQVAGIKNTLKSQSTPSITGKLRARSLPSRKACAMGVATSFQKGQRVQERILRHEKLWIQSRKIPVSQQGKNTKMMIMLEDEGTMMAVQECRASAGASMYS